MINYNDAAQKLKASYATPCLVMTETVEDSKVENKNLCKCGLTGKGIRHDSNHPNWKDDEVSYHALHEWVKNHKLKPKSNKCKICKQLRRLELCNISNETNVEERYEAGDPIIKATYNRDLKNWYYACHKCHMNKDGRSERLSLRISSFNVSVEGRAKSSLAKKGHWAAEKNPKFGKHPIGYWTGKKRPHSPETIEKIRIAHLKRRGIKMTSERRC